MKSVSTSYGLGTKGHVLSRSYCISYLLTQQNIGSNPEQAEAVCRIISDDASEDNNAPFIVFGPPGTGKTVTLVEAMVQLYKVQ